MNKQIAESQATGLIDLVLAGENPDELIEKTVASIEEGYGGGPYPIGSTVKLNKPWQTETLEGESITLQAGDVVSIIDPFHGETGNDALVLLSDGSSRTLVPLDVLGEAITEQDDLMKAPGNPAAPKATGASMTGKAKMVGDAEPPSDLPQPKGSRQPTALPGEPQGGKLPKDDPAAQVQGSEVPVTISGQLVEDVLSKLTELATRTTDDEEKECLEAIQTYLIDSEDEDLFMRAHVMLFGEGEFSLVDLANAILEDASAEADGDDLVEQKKGGLPPWMKKKDGDGEDEEEPPEDDEDEEDEEEPTDDDEEDEEEE